MKIKSIKLSITGMTCNHCATGIEKIFENQKGIISKKVNYPEAVGMFEFDDNIIDKEEIISAINKTGHYKVSSEISIRTKTEQSKYDLIIIGGGSAAFSAAIKANELGKNTLMINAGLPIGGTCVNVGCVPSKFLIRAAESIYKARNSPFQGIQTHAPEINFRKIIEQKKQLVNNLQQKKYLDILDDLPLVKTLKGFASFKNTNTVLVDNKEYYADKFLIATGASNYIPNLNGISKVNYLTNETLFDLEELPKSMIVLGGSYVALEIAQAFNRFGTKVTIIQRSKQILSAQNEDIAKEITLHLKNEGIEIISETKLLSAEEKDEQIIVRFEKSGEIHSKQAQKLVLALGTKPNTNKLNTKAIGLELTDKGYININSELQTSVKNIYAAGDCIDTPAYVYTAAYEGKIAVNNLFGQTKNTINYDYLPWVVFTDPQVAGTGMDEQQAKQAGIDYEISKIYLKDVPRSIAAFDTRGFIKLIRNKNTDKIIGARMIAPEGGELNMEILLAIKHGLTAKELGEMMHPYLTLSEGLKLAAISFGKDVNKLSCCAS